MMDLFYLCSMYFLQEYVVDKKHSYRIFRSVYEGLLLIGHIIWIYKVWVNAVHSRDF